MKEELIDMIIASYGEDERKKNTSIIKRIKGEYDYLFGENIMGEPFFLIRDETDTVGNLDQDAYMKILEEAEKADIKSPFHVYARLQIYQSNKVKFYQITDKILTWVSCPVRYRERPCTHEEENNCKGQCWSPAEVNKAIDTIFYGRRTEI